MRTQISLKSIEDDRESLDVELELDHACKRVTLHMLEFDAEHVTSFLTQSLPHDYGVSVDDPVFEHVPALPRYELVVALAGRHYPARLRHLRSGRAAIRLGDPDAEYLARCQRAVAQLLQALDAMDIEAVVTGIDRHGRPEPSEGYLHLFTRARSEEQEQAVKRLRVEVKAEHAVDVFVLHYSGGHAGVDHVLTRGAHFAWDPAAQQVMRLNWSAK